MFAGDCRADFFSLERELEPENIARVTSNHFETKVVASAPETLSFFTQYKKLNQ